MKKTYKTLSLFFLLFTLLSCEDIFEEDISNIQLVILSPLEGQVVNGNTVNFNWEFVEDADTYQLQLFHLGQIVQDTSIVNNTFNAFLDSGNYSWRLKAKNNAYETAYNFPINFEVTESEILTNQIVQLQSPSDNLYINSQEILFVWSSVPLAENYDYELRKELETGSNIVFIEENLKTNTITLSDNTIEGNSEYIWSVRAKNETSQTQYFSRTLFIDTLNPSAPILQNPNSEEEFNVSETITFDWIFSESTENVNSPISSFIELAEDENFENIIISQSLIETSIEIDFNEIGTYYWRVKGNDQAGNMGEYSSVKNFTINE